MKTIDYFKIPEVTINYSTNVKPSERYKIYSPKDLSRIFTHFHNGNMEHHERLYVLFLNNDHRVLGIYCAGVGGIGEVLTDKIKILQAAIKANATGIAVSHNHPSGSLTPSEKDIAFTNSLKIACSCVGINFIDHVIVTSEGSLSFADSGIMIKM